MENVLTHEEIAKIEKQLASHRATLRDLTAKRNLLVLKAHNQHGWRRMVSNFLLRFATRAVLEGTAIEGQLVRKLNGGDATNHGDY